MKKALLLFASLLVAGCGEKSASEGSESVGEKPTAPSESAEPSGDTPKSLSDADVEQLLKEAVDGNSLEKREGLLYQVGESESFSGWTKGRYESGEVGHLVQIKNGQMEGLRTWWHENGQQMGDQTMKDGKMEGLAISWYENGQKEIEVTYKDVVQHGLFTEWYENGKKKAEGTYKEGEPDGLWTEWDNNGQKQFEITYKDGEEVSERGFK